MNLRYDISERLLHFKQPAGTSRGIYTTRRAWFVTLTDDAGRQGMGECAPLPNLSCDDIPGYARQLGELCEQLCHEAALGQWTAATARQRAFGRETPLREAFRPFPSMQFGIETALCQMERGSTALFDTHFARGTEGIPINGLVWMGSFDEMLGRIEEKMKAGFRCVKLKIGAIDFDQELELIRHIRRSFSKEQIELRVDANGAFTPQSAMGRLEQLAKYDIHSIEQPIRQHQWPEMARLCRHSPLPIALDEELIGVNRADQKQELLDTLAPAYIILKPSLHGGMAGSAEWIAMARERGIGSWITSALESNVGLNAIAHLTAAIYGSGIAMPQGLGTGMLFTDNIPMPLEIRGDMLWYVDE